MSYCTIWLFSMQNRYFILIWDMDFEREMSKIAETAKLLKWS